MMAVAEAIRGRPHQITEEAPLHDGSDRYRIYILVRKPDPRDQQHRTQRWLADTSLDGIGGCLSTLRAEEQITNDDKVGIRDRIERTWLVNPYAVGR